MPKSKDARETIPAINRAFERGEITAAQLVVLSVAAATGEQTAEGITRLRKEWAAQNATATANTPAQPTDRARPHAPNHAMSG